MPQVGRLALHSRRSKPINLSAVCGQPIGSVSQQLIQLQPAFQAATLATGAATNGNFIGNSLSASGNINGINMFAPNYQTPRSVQMNIGFEKQLGKGVVWNADYLRNVGTHTLLAIDTNHVGDARFFNKGAATTAIAATTTAFGCGGGTTATAINCAIAAGATIADFAGQRVGFWHQRVWWRGLSDRFENRGLCPI